MTNSFNLTAKNSSGKTVFYCRKSSEGEDRQVLSIASQIQECTQVAERYGLNEFEIICESKSAKQPARPNFNQMISRIHSCEFDTVICWKLDRLARNPVDGASLIWMLEKGVIQRIITPTQVYYPQDNHILMYVEFGMASQYSRDLSTNVKRGNKTKLESGWWTGVAPLGYLNNPKKSEDPIINDPERYHTVQKMWKMMVTGQYSVLELLRIANDQWNFRTPQKAKSGGGKLSKTSLYNLFRNPFYYGFMQRGDIEAWGKHQAMITFDEFKQVQRALDRKGGSKPHHRDFAFTGLITCASCGGKITAEHQTNRHGTTYTYYHCTKRKKHLGNKCPQKYIQGKDLEKQILQAIESFEIPQAYCDWIIEYLRWKHAQEVKERSELNGSYQSQYNACQSRIDNLLDLKLGGLVTDDEFSKKKAELLHERNQLKERLENIEQRADHWLKLCEDTFNFAANVKDIFYKSSTKEKNAILMAMGSEFLLDNKVLSIQWHKPFEILRSGQASIRKFPKEGIMFEPSKISLFVRKNGENGKKAKKARNLMFEPLKSDAIKTKIQVSESDCFEWLATMFFCRTGFFCQLQNLGI